MEFVDRSGTRFGRSMASNEVPLVEQAPQDVTGALHVGQLHRHWSCQPRNECCAEEDLLDVRVHMSEQLTRKILEKHARTAA